MPAATVKRYRGPRGQAMVEVGCDICGQKIKKLESDGRTTCRDQGKCQERAKSLAPLAGPPPVEASPSESEPAPDTLSPDKLIEWVRKKQAGLSVQAAGLSDMVMLKLGQIVQDGGVKIITSATDGGQIEKFVPLKAEVLAGILRELRPIVHEPVRAQEDQPKAPVTINTNNPEVIREVVRILRENRERQLAQARHPILLEDV
jgi:hypothetical protein